MILDRRLPVRRRGVGVSSPFAACAAERMFESEETGAGTFGLVSPRFG